MRTRTGAAVKVVFLVSHAAEGLGSGLCAMQPFIPDSYADNVQSAERKLEALISLLQPRGEHAAGSRARPNAIDQVRDERQ
jgi:hypothetical protein